MSSQVLTQHILEEEKKLQAETEQQNEKDQITIKEVS